MLLFFFSLQEMLDLSCKCIYLFSQVVCRRWKAYLLRLLQQCLLQEVHFAQPGQKGAVEHHR